MLVMKQMLLLFVENETSKNTRVNACLDQISDI